MLVKIAPDLDDEQIDAIAGLAVELGLAGVIANNTTISREGLTADPSDVEAMGAGGLSGAPVAARSLEVLRRVRAAVPADFCVIAVGGVTTEPDVQERIDAGATLVQGYTAFLYEGPTWARASTGCAGGGCVAPRGRRDHLTDWEARGDTATGLPSVVRVRSTAAS